MIEKEWEGRTVKHLEQMIDERRTACYTPLRFHLYLQIKLCNVGLRQDCGRPTLVESIHKEYFMVMVSIRNVEQNIEMYSCLNNEESE